VNSCQVSKRRWFVSVQPITAPCARLKQRHDWPSASAQLLQMMRVPCGARWSLRVDMAMFCKACPPALLPSARAGGCLGWCLGLPVVVGCSTTPPQSPARRRPPPNRQPPTMVRGPFRIPANAIAISSRLQNHRQGHGWFRCQFHPRSHTLLARKKKKGHDSQASVTCIYHAAAPIGEPAAGRPIKRSGKQKGNVPETLFMHSL
jgi:hypothetical protein